MEVSLRFGVQRGMDCSPTARVLQKKKLFFGRLLEFLDSILDSLFVLFRNSCVFHVLLGELDLTPEQLVAVNKDLKYRNTWDEFAKTLTEVEVIDKTTSVVYWRVAYPWPMSHRDYRMFWNFEDDKFRIFNNLA